MKSDRKAQGEIIGKPAGMHRRIAELERSEAEYKQAEKALRESEKRFHSLVETTSDWIWEVDPNGFYTFSNSKVRDILGYDPGEVVGKKPFDFMPAHEAERVAALFGDIAESQRPFSGLENINLHKDGRQIVLETSGVPIFDEKGNFSGYKGIDRDTTKRKQMEEELRQREREYRSIFENSVMGIFRIGPDARYLSVNPAGARMHGYRSPEEMIEAVTDITHQVYVHPEDRKRLREPLERDGFVEDFEVEHYTKDGSTIWVSVNARVIRDASGAILYYETTSQNITGRKRAEEELVRLNRIQRMLSNINQALIHITDEATLLSEVCRISVEVGGYRMAWVGFAEHDEAKTVRPIAHAGFDSGYIKSANITWADRERGRGPTGTAIRTGQPYIVHNIPSDPAFGHWREEAIKRGYKSSIALPLISEGQTLGALNIYGDEVDVFDAKEVEILKELADDLAFGITVLRTRAKRDLAEEALRHSEHRKTILNDIANIFLTIPDEAMYGEALTVVLRVMRSRYGIFGYIGENGDLIIPSLTRDIWKDCKVPDKSIVFPSDTWGESLWGRAMREKKALYSNESFRIPEGHVHIDNFLTAPIVFGKETIGLLSVANKEGGYTEEDKNLLESIANFISPILRARLQRDIHERGRKEAEEALKESEEKYRGIFENAVEGIFQSTPEGRFINVNPASAHMHGYDSPEEMITSIANIGQQLWVDPKERMVFSGLLRESGIVKNFETKLYRKDGATILISVNAHTVKDTAGKIRYYEGIVEDITSRKLAEEELKATTEKLRTTLVGTIRAIALTVETRDPYTAGHQKRVASLARAIAQEMGLPKDTIEGIRMAAVIHDIGKISVPAEILSKPTRLTDIEFGLIKVHPEAGYAILKDIDFPWPVADIVLQHHERLDGSGYPQGLKGEQILLEAQILAVADVIEAMASHRPYRPSIGIDVALAEIEKNRGTFYNVKIVDACVRLFREKGFRFQ